MRPIFRIQRLPRSFFRCQQGYFRVLARVYSFGGAEVRSCRGLGGILGQNKWLCAIPNPTAKAGTGQACLAEPFTRVHHTRHFSWTVFNKMFNMIHLKFKRLLYRCTLLKVNFLPIYAICETCLVLSTVSCSPFESIFDPECRRQKARREEVF